MNAKWRQFWCDCTGQKGENTMKKCCKRNLLLAAAVAAAAGGAGTTIAYFTDTETKTNVFTMGDLDLGLLEPEWDPEPNPEDEEPDGTKTPDGQNMYPGYTVYKNPTIKNITSDENGEEPCYARIRVTVTDQEGKRIEDEEALNLVWQMIYFDESYSGDYEHTGQAEGLIEGRVPGYSLEELSQYPMVNPVFVKDEKRSDAASFVFSYIGAKGDGVMLIGDEAALFTNVVVPTDWTQTELRTIGDFHLDIEAECIQCSGFASQEDAFAALDEAIESEATESRNVSVQEKES